MAQILSVDPAKFPGPASNRNTLPTVCTGGSATPPTTPTTGQLWPRGNQP